ncbi:MAG: hypothetical protein O9289_02320 [Rhodobacteraceae bacterium]|jgi:hypothetical protein|nr:hypothetical protein [Paracoccaceae bacterium]MCZ8082009.1 hypothetical protein [Paracoccaceae bacterium]
MMNIAMAKVVVGMVGASGAVGPAREADDAELAQAGLAEAGAWSPMGWVRGRWQLVRGHFAPTAGGRAADVAFAATAIAVAQGVMPPQVALTEGLNADSAAITDSRPAVE